MEPPEKCDKNAFFFENSDQKRELLKHFSESSQSPAFIKHFRDKTGPKDEIGAKTGAESGT